MRFPDIDFSLHTHQEFSLFQARQMLENASREQLIETCLSLLEQKFLALVQQKVSEKTGNF